MKEVRNIYDASLMGWAVGAGEDGLSIHHHINYPGEWRLTCRSLELFNVRLCPDSVTDPEAIKAKTLELLTRKLETMQEQFSVIIHKVEESQC